MASVVFIIDTLGGRDYSEIEKTRLATAFTDSDVVDKVKAVQNVGIEHVICNAPQIDTLEPIRYFEKEVIPEFS